MPPKYDSPRSIVSPRMLVPVIGLIVGLLAGCGTGPSLTPEVDLAQTAPAEAAGVSAPTPFESTPVQTSPDSTDQSFSSDQLGLCFSYPEGYTRNPSPDSVGIYAPDLPGSDVKGIFWLEISDAYDRTAETIADQDLTFAPGLEVGRWTVMVGGEEGVVLDGMPGQELQRRLYVVHQGTLYVLAFWPALSENKAAGSQMEALYDAVTNSWAWSPCSAGE